MTLAQLLALLERQGITGTTTECLDQLLRSANVGSTPREIRERLALLSRAVLTEARSAGRDDLDAEQRAVYDRATSAIQRLSSEIDEGRGDVRRDGPAFWQDSLGDASSQRRHGPTGARYAEMFPGRTERSNHGFSSLEEFLTPLSRGMWDPRYNNLRTMNTGDNNGTGLHIPTEFTAELFDQSLEGELVRPRARIYPMRTATRKIAGITAGVGGAPFGISGGWTAEGGTISQSEPDSRAVTLTAHKLAVMSAVTNEVIADGMTSEGPPFDEQLATAQSRGMGWFLDKAFLTGNGAGQPLGILNSPALVTVSKESGQAADTIIYDNLVKMFARMHPAHIGRSVWVANASAIPMLLTLGQIVGVGGAPIPVLREGANGWSLLTRPILFTEKVPAIGDKGDIMLIDFSQYAIGLRAELQLEKSIHVGFTADLSYYRGIMRADGLPLWDAPYTPAAGDTLSPFVALEAR